MVLQGSRLNGLRMCVVLAAVALTGVSLAQTTPDPTVPVIPAPPPIPTPAPVTPPPVTPAPVTPAPVTPAPVTPAPTPAPPAPAPTPATPAPVPPKADIVPIPDANVAADPATTPFEVKAKPVAVLRGKATWEDGYKTIHEGFKKITDALAAEKIGVIDKPIAVFVETNDADFKYELMVPVDKVPEGKTGITGDIVFGLSPAGKVLKFQHRASYDEIDSTYEAITAYLDEKGYESKDLFAEEYLNDAKGSDDSALQVDVYVYLK